MSRLLLAFRVFFRVLFAGDVAKQVSALLEAPAPAASPSTTAASNAPQPTKAKTPADKHWPTSLASATPARSEALTLLATLQREARFVDFIQEPLTNYSDAQIGAAARDVHRNCAEVLERTFQLRPVLTAAEGSEVDVPDGAAATRFRLVGNVGAPSPRRGKLCHGGWQASQCQLPQWTGDDESRLIVAPAEVELR